MLFRRRCYRNNFRQGQITIDEMKNKIKQGAIVIDVRSKKCSSNKDKEHRCTKTVQKGISEGKRLIILWVS